LKTIEDGFWLKVNKDGPLPAEFATAVWPEIVGTQCWVWTGKPDDEGYGKVYAGYAEHRAHRVSWYIEHGAWPMPHCLHKCDNPLCVRPSHLREGTHAENMADKAAKGRAPRGSALSQSKLTEAKVMEIRQLYSTGEFSKRALGRRFGVAHQTINSIFNGVWWKHVPLQ
jgi:HNH endonuclease/CENP-B N-terminal DNA-binding domain